MPKMNLSHFEAALLFALFTSVVLGATISTSRCGMSRSMQLATSVRYGMFECVPYARKIG